MGREYGKIIITTTLSRHNDPRDDRDDALHRELAQRVRALAMDPQFEEIVIDTESDPA